MIRPIIRDTFFLSQKSKPAGKDDLAVVRDLVDTLTAHRNECVGMAANMIGVAKRIIAFDDNGRIQVMLNPQMVSKSIPYETEEGCLSLSGQRSATRYQSIEVRFQTPEMRTETKRYLGWTAQIIQHELDHLEGILI